jgi:hypothetical protein
VSTLHALTQPLFFFFFPVPNCNANDAPTIYLEDNLGSNPGPPRDLNVNLYKSLYEKNVYSGLNISFKGPDDCKY